jgi:hypothetical protein
MIDLGLESHKQFKCLRKLSKGNKAKIKSLLLSAYDNKRRGHHYKESESVKVASELLKGLGFSEEETIKIFFELTFRVYGSGEFISIMPNSKHFLYFAFRHKGTKYRDYSDYTMKELEKNTALFHTGKDYNTNSIFRKYDKDVWFESDLPNKCRKGFARQMVCNQICNLKEILK